MMESIKKYIAGIIIGLLLGLWFGANLGKGQPFWSNPFDERKFAEQAKEKAVDLGERAKEKAVDLSGKAKEKADVMIKDAKKAVIEKLEDKEDKKE